MTRHAIRLVGGVMAGQEVIFDTSKGNVLRLPKHPDFNVCDTCKDATAPDDLPQHFEEYRIHHMQFAEGYVHHYGFPVAGESLAHALNEMWHGYKQSLRRDRGE